MVKIKLRLTNEEATYLGLEIKPRNPNQYGNPTYSISREDEDRLIAFRGGNLDGIKEASDDAKLDIRDLKHGWLKTDKASLFFKNPDYAETYFNLKEFDFEASFKDVDPIQIKKKQLKGNFNAEFDRLVYTDTHLGMDVDENGLSLYDLSWTKEDILQSIETMVKFTLENKKSTIIHILDLGDFLDGFNKQTTRGGHELPQNLTNQEAFDLGLKFKTLLVESLLPYYDKIICHNICNDNHAGDFAYCLNSAFKIYAEKVYEGVKVVNQTKFIDHTIIGNRCFVTTHGKDKKHLKFGFKPKLDANQVNKIVGYLNAKNLLNQGYEIIFEKGDSHQYLLDSSSSDIFHYYNYPALSPSSNWVQTNFQKGKRGFVMFNYYQNRKSVNEYFFN